jgi:hypothetical protein
MPMMGCFARKKEKHCECNGDARLLPRCCDSGTIRRLQSDCTHAEEEPFLSDSSDAGGHGARSDAEVAIDSNTPSTAPSSRCDIFNAGLAGYQQARDQSHRSANRALQSQDVDGSR